MVGATEDRWKGRKRPSLPALTAKQAAALGGIATREMDFPREFLENYRVLNDLTTTRNIK
jgi:hypothetical protein